MTRDGAVAWSRGWLKQAKAGAAQLKNVYIYIIIQKEFAVILSRWYKPSRTQHVICRNHKKDELQFV